MSSIAEINFESCSKRKARRVGRGSGSGRGKTSQRGHKGQGSRSGSSMNPVFEGGQMPLVRRIPKRGFNNKEFAEVVAAVNVDDLEIYFDAGAEVQPAVLQEKGLLRQRFDRVKILGGGELTKKLSVRAHAFSEQAKSKIESAGGTVEILPAKKAVVKNKMGSRLKAVKAAAEERAKNKKVVPNKAT